MVLSYMCLEIEKFQKENGTALGAGCSSSNLQAYCNVTCVHCALKYMLNSVNRMAQLKGTCYIVHNAEHSYNAV